MRFKVGDIVVIKDNINGHCFEIGERVKIIKVTGYDYRAESLKNGRWYVTDQEIKKTSKQIDLNVVERILHFTNMMLEHNNKTLQSFENYEQFEKFVMKNKSKFIGFNRNKSGFIETLQFMWSLK